MKLLNCYRMGTTKVIFIALFVMAGLAQAETITVGSPRRGDYDFYSIQDAIDAANDEDVVLITPQEYYLSNPITFRGKAITVRSEAGPEQTIIRPYQSYNINIVEFVNGEDSRSMLEGFTIKDSSERGVFCEYSSPRIKNCMFIDNWESGIKCFVSSPIINNCIITGSVGDSGINCEENSSPTITNCNIFANSCIGTGGGGILCRDSSPIITDCNITDNTAPDNEGGGTLYINSSPKFINCNISNNTAKFGAGICNIENSNPTFTNCIFSGNSAEESGGGMYNEVGSSPTLTNCIFEFNEASDAGGGMYNAENSSPTLTNCTFSGNSTSDGGGMCNHDSNPTLTNCIFTGNSAYDGGGMANYESSPIVTNCTFSNNTGVYGGGMWNEFSNNPSVTNCTFNDNSAEEGGGMGNYASSPIVTNCILWGNTAPNGAQIYNTQGSSTTVRYSNVQSNGRYPWPGEGNIKKDPLFADEENGDYHLKSSAGRWDPHSHGWIFDDVSSPCLDTGNPNSPVAFEPYPNGIFINMGAYGGTAEASKSPSSLNANYGYGTGEPDNPYLIYTAEQLNSLGNELNDWDKNFTLMADIDLSEYLYDRAVIAWDMNDFELDFQGTYFTGVFNGNDYSISNLRIQGDNFLGLFGQLGNEAMITNLNMETMYIDGTGDYIGGLAGFNCGYIAESHSTGDVSGSSNIGGLLGSNTGTMFQCSCNGLVSGNNYVGGLAGNNCCGLIASSYSNINIVGVSYTGGLVGDNMFGSIIRCYSKGTVNGDQYIGGLGGCYVDGFVSNCYSAAVVTGNIGVGGLLGGPSNESDWGLGIHYVGGSFWEMEISGQSSSYGGIGLNTAEMQTESTFIDAGWDFMYEGENGTNDIWWIDQDQDYPHLWWESMIEIIPVHEFDNIVYQINCSGEEVPPFTADQYYSGGMLYTQNTSPIDTTNVTNPAPEAVYNTVRWTPTTYTFPNLTSGVSYKVRLHFAEVHASAANTRLFNVIINDDTVLTEYSIYSEAGDMNKAVIEEFTTTANTSGQIVIEFTAIPDSGQPAIAGIEIIKQ